MAITAALRVKHMQIIDYGEAVDLVMHGGREDICLMIPQPMDKLPMLEVRKLAQGGAVFAVMTKDPDLQEEEIQSSANKETGACLDDQESKPVRGRRVNLDVGKVMALHEAGWSNRKIAEEMDCSEGTIWNCLKKMENQI